MNGANASVMPPAGHYADMQTIMQNMETLSGWLQQNREEWAGLQESLARVEGSVNAVSVVNGCGMDHGRGGDMGCEAYCWSRADYRSSKSHRSNSNSRCNCKMVIVHNVRAFHNPFTYPARDNAVDMSPN